MNITIAGCGNIGTQFAVHASSKGHKVKMYGSKPEKISKHLSIADENDNIIKEGDIVCATSDPEVAFKGADLIFVTFPAFSMSEIEEIIYPYAGKGMKIALVPGTGGGECAFKKCVDKGAVVFGLQRVPSVARLVKYGQTVRALGYRSELFVAAIPKSHTSECCSIIAELFDIPCTAMPNYLSLTLTPSNPILHTTRLKTLFEDYTEGVTYESIPLFYEQWNDKSSELLFKCDEEVQRLCKKLDMFDLSYVKSLKLHYESDTPKQLTEKITSIESFKGLKTPSVETENGLIPDLSSRYFTADFPYGLEIIKQICTLASFDAPNITETLEWYYKVAGKHARFDYSLFGINTLDDFLSFYLM